MAGSAKSFGIWQLVRLTFSSVRGNARLFARAAVAPIAIVFLLSVSLSSLGLSFLDTTPVDSPAGGVAIFAAGGLIVALVHGVLTMAFAVVCHRRVLLGEGMPTVLGIGLGRNEFRFFLYSLFLVVVALVPTSVLSFLFFAVVGTVGEEAGGWIFFVPFFAGLLLTMVLLVKGSLGLPAMALGLEQGCLDRFRLSWRQTRGVALTLFLANSIVGVGLILFIFIVGALPALIGALLGMESLSLLLRLVGDFLFAAFVATLLSLVFRRHGDMPPVDEDAGQA